MLRFYDLFRIENGKIVEHWDTIEEIPPRSEWKNQNGKFGFSRQTPQMSLDSLLP